MSVRYSSVQGVNHQSYQVPCVPLFWMDSVALCSCSYLQDFCSLSILVAISEPSEKLNSAFGYFYYLDTLFTKLTWAPCQ